MTNLYEDNFKQKEDALYAKRAKENTVINRKLILEQAIQKAIDGGWNATLDGSTLRKIGSEGKPYAWIGAATWGSKDLIFSHDFAKALWGEELFAEEFDSPIPRFPEAKKLDIRPVWQYNLQQMVIAEDPIKYLGDHIL